MLLVIIPNFDSMIEKVKNPNAHFFNKTINNDIKFSLKIARNQNNKHLLQDVLKQFDNAEN